jgi:hypothetical protein
MAEESIRIDGDFARLRSQFEPAERDLPIRALGVISRSRFLTEHLILNPESFYPLRRGALAFREVRDFCKGIFRLRRA